MCKISPELRIALIGLIGALIGGSLTFYSSYWYWSEQQNTLEQQKIDEQHRLATAFYTEISMLENRINNTLAFSPKNMEEFEKSTTIQSFDTKYYDKDGLYYVFNKEILGFDNITSASLYVFYNDLINTQNTIDFMNEVQGKYLHNETLSPYDLFLAHQYSVELFKIRIPNCISNAEILKKRLRENYHADNLISLSFFAFWPATLIGYNYLFSP